ncbi:hypothetical protein D3C78_1360740 [compost metagenome]
MVEPAKKLFRDGRLGCEVQAGRTRAVQGGQRSLGLIHQFAHLQRIGLERLAMGRRRHSATAAMEKPAAQALLHLADSAAERRHITAQFQRDGGQAAGRGDQFHQVQVFGVHGPKVNAGRRA